MGKRIILSEEETDIIIKLYESGQTLKEISSNVNLSRVTISNILKENNIKVFRKVKPFSEEHRRKISISKKGNKNSLGVKKSKLNNYKNMRGHLLFDVELEWLCSFTDIDKLKFLNKIVSNVRKHNRNEPWSNQFYREFIEKFYYDDKFNKIYSNWLVDKNKWKKPSIDHIDSNNRKNELSNFQFLTWFENRCKNDITQTEWDKMKENINEYFL
jgi:hypothetical protein